MVANPFANAKFNFAWEIPLSISLFGSDFEITASADAYYPTDEVTVEQNNAYQSFIENYKDIINNVEKLLLKESGSVELAEKRFTPKILKIKRNGNLGIVFDDKNDFENGLVISIFPSYELMSTDEYF